MAEIMQYFAVELDSFVNEYNGKHWDVDFVGTEYPPEDRDGAGDTASL